MLEVLHFWKILILVSCRVCWVVEIFLFNYFLYDVSEVVDDLLFLDFFEIFVYVIEDILSRSHYIESFYPVYLKDIEENLNKIKEIVYVIQLFINLFDIEIVEKV